MVTESNEKQPYTKKGKIRLELEGIARESGVPVLIAHFPELRT